MGRPKRNIQAAAEESATPPESLTAAQSVARVVKAEGNNLYTCLVPAGEASAESKTVLVELAARFRNTIWIKRNGYVLVELTPLEERRENVKVDGEIVNVVRDERAWRKQAYWPKEFPRHTYPEDEDDGDSSARNLPPSDSE